MTAFANRARFWFSTPMASFLELSSSSLGKGMGGCSYGQQRIKGESEIEFESHPQEASSLKCGNIQQCRSLQSAESYWTCGKRV